jgi:hypothetical protein
MNLFMVPSTISNLQMWMAGNNVQIFSMMIVFMLLQGSVKAIVSYSMVFANLESGAPKSFLADKLILPKLTFCGIQVVLLGLGLYKCNSMGLLPTSQSDWLAFKEVRAFREIVGAGGDTFPMDM